MSKDSSFLLFFVQKLWGGLAALLLFVMMIVTCADVTGRYFLNAPLPGAFEITEILLGLIIYAILPLVTISGDQIAVDMFDRFIPPQIRLVQNFIILVIQTVMLSLIAWALASKSLTLIRTNLVTDVIRLPMGYVALLMAVLTALSVLSLIAFTLFKGRNGHTVAAKTSMEALL